jgi:hypothetical protein
MYTTENFEAGRVSKILEGLLISLSYAKIKFINLIKHRERAADHYYNTYIKDTADAERLQRELLKHGKSV